MRTFTIAECGARLQRMLAVICERRETAFTRCRHLQLPRSHPDTHTSGNTALVILRVRANSDDRLKV